MTRRLLQLTKTLEMDPKFVPAQHAIEAAYAQNGMFKEAIGERQKVLTLSGNPDLAASIGEDFNASGYPGVLKSWLEGLKEVSKRGYVSSYNMAQIYARLGDKNQALAALEQAYQTRQQPHVCEGRTRLRRLPFRSQIPEDRAAARMPQ